MTVISGTFNMGTGDKLDTQKTKALIPGSAAIMQPKPITSPGQITKPRFGSMVSALGRSIM